MADLTDPTQRLTQDQIAGLCGVHARTVRRWMRHGVRVAGGRAVKLRHRYTSRNYTTTRAWLDKFLAAASPPDPTAAP